MLQIWRQWARGKVRKASTSSLARRMRAAALSKRSASMASTWSHCAAVSSGE